MFVYGDAEGRPDRETLFRRQVRWSPPDNEIPGALPLNLMLGRTGSLAVAMINAQVYSVGIEFSMVVSSRGASDETLGGEIFGHHWGPDRGSGSPLLLGVEYADGRTASAAGRHFLSGEGDNVPSLVQHGGGGGGHSYKLSYWLTPLPSGEVAIICAWPGRGIDETRTTIRASALAEARDAIVTLWPWEPEPEPDAAPEPPAIELPPGWFADHPPHKPEPPTGQGWTLHGG